MAAPGSRLEKLFTRAMAEALIMSRSRTVRKKYKSELLAGAMAEASIMTLPDDTRERIYEDKLIASHPVMLGPYHPYHKPHHAEQNFCKMMQISDQREEVSHFYTRNNAFVLEVANLHPTSLTISRKGLYRKLCYKPPTPEDLAVGPTKLRKLTYRCQKYTDEKDPWCLSYLELDVALSISPFARRPWRVKWRYDTTSADETRQALKRQVRQILDLFGNNGNAAMIMSPAAIRQISDVLWRSCEQHPWRPVPRGLR
ncbi:hypothetical protein LTR78_008662 [Recurvomyces mirabilis]|uniref:Uncharacterized protein n=1 Tax=Recurvomyces mirabilis TaxID=574656 RepID=A0AAE0WIW2_9PEZI|nr:hypothetical protein LTR78_008662 [Recurvomyces mirabilis]KAK5159253.1 hypothetical protein LTS14_002395 [Recurvomyces mirabilis]